MDFLTSLPLPLGLVILALLDGTSVGTLLVPIFLLIAPGKPRVPRILLYLGTITVFYFAVGLLLLLGVVNVIDIGRAFLDSEPGQLTLLTVGIALFAIGIWMGVADSRRAKRIKAGDLDAVARRGRLLRWRERLLSDRTGRAGVMGIALVAGLIEVAGMLPYLIGVTLIGNAPIAGPMRVAALAGYCLVMVLPALVLLVARIAAAQAVERPLERFAGWMERTGAETTSWLFGIIGFLLARAAMTQLGIRLPFIGG